MSEDGWVTLGIIALMCAGFAGMGLFAKWFTRWSDQDVRRMKDKHK